MIPPLPAGVWRPRQRGGSALLGYLSKLAQTTGVRFMSVTTRLKSFSASKAGKNGIVFMVPSRYVLVIFQVIGKVINCIERDFEHIDLHDSFLHLSLSRYRLIDQALTVFL